VPVRSMIARPLGWISARLPRSARRRWRRVVLRIRGWPDLEGLQDAGLQLGARVFVGGGTVFDADFPFLIAIGDDTVIGPDVMLLAHDASTRRDIGYSRVAPIVIGRRAFVGARVIVLPGVTIGDDAIVGAGSVVRRNVAPGTVVAGNPARVIGTTTEYLARHRRALEVRPTWERQGWTASGGITPENRRRMREALSNGEAFVR
jgi:maltose O-acetyltransferase